MSKDKQTEIDEIAKLICTYPQCVNYNKIGGCKIAECQTVDIAENLFEQGYRKSTDIAEEIFAEIERALNLSKCYGDSGIYFEKDIETDIAELKKKYTEEGE